ncbi:MAG: peroxiredoxin [Methyloceanibacter sp.]|jgi:peroxiredoxin
MTPVESDDANNASHPKPGLALPGISLPATTGDTMCLADVPGTSVVFVYPWTGRPGHPNPPNWDDIPGAHGSTPEIEGFRDLYAAFRQLGILVFGLSYQTTDYQREMTERLGVPFPILSDAAGRFAAALDLPSFATGGTNYLKRLTFIVEAGHIEHVFFPVPEPETHAGEVLHWLEQEGAGRRTGA